jgi:hypothetical protein
MIARFQRFNNFRFQRFYRDITYEARQLVFLCSNTANYLRPFGATAPSTPKQVRKGHKG